MSVPVLEALEPLFRVSDRLPDLCDIGRRVNEVLDASAHLPAIDLVERCLSVQEGYGCVSSHDACLQCPKAPEVYAALLRARNVDLPEDLAQAIWSYFLRAPGKELPSESCHVGKMANSLLEARRKGLVLLNLPALECFVPGHCTSCVNGPPLFQEIVLQALEMGWEGVPEVVQYKETL